MAQQLEDDCICTWNGNRNLTIVMHISKRVSQIYGTHKILANKKKSMEEWLWKSAIQN